MGTKRIAVEFCDVCKIEGTNLTKYRLGQADGTLKRLDLCPTHAQPLADLLGDSKGRKRRSSRQVVTDPEQIRRAGSPEFQPST